MESTMTRRKPIRAAVVAAMLTVVVALPSVAGAGNRIPVSSVDDATSPIANRIAAVTNIVNATNARLARVIAAWPPNPCAEITPVCPASLTVVGSYSALGKSVAEVCGGTPGDGLGVAVISDADAFAGDTSTTGIADQLTSIATVLGNADDRLGGIHYPNPGPPSAPEAAALSALSVAIAAGGFAADGWIGYLGGFNWPPNPCVSG
jgi:hypothetical protein